MSEMMDYPAWICLDCGRLWGRRSPSEATTWHDGTCDICGEKNAVSEPRDFGHLRGEYHGSSNLTEEDIREIRKLLGTTPQREIAKKFNVSRWTICRIKDGKSCLGILRTADRVCSVEGCDKLVEGKGLCQAHYQRQCNHGDPLGGRTPNGEPLTFFNTVVMSYEGIDCLIWPYNRGSDGYARLWFDETMSYVSRLACERTHGPAPTDEHHAAHTCGQGSAGCVNRHHLRWATPADNNADRFIHGTASQGERHGCAKLTDEDVHAIRHMSGTPREIAAKFQVSPRTINNIKSGDTWQHLKPVWEAAARRE